VRDRYLSAAALVIVGAVVAYLLWQVRSAVLLAFASVLVAVVLSALVRPTERHTPLSRPWSLFVVVIAIAMAFAAGGWLIGSTFYEQAQLLAETLPDAAGSFEAEVARIGRSLFPGLADIDTESVDLQSLISGAVSRMLSWGNSLFTLLTSLIVLIVAGVFLAAEPDKYRRGLLRIAEQLRLRHFERALDAVGRALTLWMAGKLAAMTIIGALSAAAAWVLGLPAPLILGLLMGLCSFVPVLGPIVGAIPALLLALTMGVDTLLWAIVLYVGIEQLESNLITPRINENMVDVPAALFLFAVMAFGLLFGMLGLLLAGPLTVAGFALAKVWLDVAETSQ